MGSTVVDLEEMDRDVEAAAGGTRGMMKIAVTWRWLQMAGRG